ncbi:MAG: ABC transporter ATP-binding protein [Gammaproteobacteria bacterium]|nr:MAG: ABC transporter ATP-binding protein [Gammaproteobacteria bacterium]UCH40250.1 MAG: ABC transporter ATP-binding protein [Gammaproteobacteria bacterium]
MARIDFNNVKHAYPPPPGQAPVYALKEVNQVWEDGGAYALLGPSGCGKTTLLNIISGLLMPSAGSILFDGREVTQLPTTERHIAQVFQFPVVYDTMTVFDNLAFPLRNRGMSEARVNERVGEIAKMLDLTDRLQQRAAGLTADGKQKISLGRGLVREAVNAILFDEPLTVIDPHLKWQLRSKLKELHQQIGVTMIYVTHDQVEALTFADKVVVMHDGSVVQVGTPVELFNRPRHTFVGYFIGSPGMNVLPCSVDNGQPVFANNLLYSGYPAIAASSGKLEIGIRPEFVRFSDDGIPVVIEKVEDLGRYQIVTVSHAETQIKMLISEDQPIPAESPKIEFDPANLLVYRDNWLMEAGSA